MWKIAAAVALAFVLVPVAAHSATPLDDLCLPAGIVRSAICLSGGHWEGQAAAGSASRPTVDLLPLFADADLDGDGKSEVTGFVTESSGGSGTRLHLVVARPASRKTTFVTSMPLGDRVQVKELAIVNYQLSLGLIEHGPGEPACCPTHLTSRMLTLRGADLVQLARMDLGSVALGDLAGSTWKLVGFGVREAAPASPTVEITVDGERISGFAGCNRFTGTIAEGAPREIRISSVAATKATCGEAETALENRVLAALEGATRYGFVAGMLSLDGANDEGGHQDLLFRR